MSSDDYDFLYNYALEQAERVQELGKLSDNLKHELFSVRIERDLLKEEVKALKKSINFLEKQRERMGNNHQQTIKDAGLLLKQNKRYREALEEVMKIQENHEWNLYGIAYGIAERTLFEAEGEEQ